MTETCEHCLGSGVRTAFTQMVPDGDTLTATRVEQECWACQGSGQVDKEGVAVTAESPGGVNV